MKSPFPTWQIPGLHPTDEKRSRLNLAETAALWIGCGLGSGFFKPGPGTWGSVVGFIYAACLLRMTLAGGLLTAAVVIVLSIWSAGVCERLLKKKDPGEVVIDEIASIPIAIWPMVPHPHQPVWVWLAAFVLFRVFDIAKPFPIKQLQVIKGGLGILIDDLVAALFTSLIIWAVVRR